MNSVAKLVSSTDIETLTGRVTDKQLATIARLGKLMRKRESNLRETIEELKALGYGVNVAVKNTGEILDLDAIELTFNRLK